MGSPKPDPNPERRLTALARILKVLRETDEPQQLVQAVLENLQSELHYTLLWLGTYDRINHRLISQGCRSPKPERLLDSTLPMNPGDLMEQVVIQQRPLIVNDLRIEPRAGTWCKVAERQGLQSALLFPLRYRDACYGLMMLGKPQWGDAPTPSDRTYLSTVLGTLADRLHRHDQIQQQQQRKLPESSVFGLVNQLETLTDFDDQLATLLLETQNFIHPARTRLFWFEPQVFQFWERLSTSSGKANSYKQFQGEDSPLTISADIVRGAYQTLMANQLVAVDESQGLTTSNVPEKLMQTLETRSLLAAPIFSQGDLKGFLSVEGRESRLWSLTEKRYLSAVARLAGLAVPASTLADTLNQQQADLRLLNGILGSIHNDSDWRHTLETCGSRLCDRLQAQQFLVLLHDSERGGYEVALQYPLNTSFRRAVSLTWGALDEVDWQMLEHSTEAIAIPDLAYDLKLMAWRDNLQLLGLRSALACNTSPGHAPEGVILLANQQVRHWTVVEQELMMGVARQLGLILHQWQLQRRMNQQEHLHDAIQWGLQTLQRTFTPNEMEDQASRHLADLLEVSLVALVSWQIGETTGRVSHCAVRHKDFDAELDWEVPLSSDAVVNWALQTDGLLPVTAEDFPSDTRAWLKVPSGSKCLLMALRTAPDHVPNSVLVLADQRDRKWSDYHLSLITILANQLAWSRRHLSLTEMLLTQREELETLNWYKQRRLDEVYRRLDMYLQRFQGASLEESGQLAQQLVRQLGSLLNGMAGVLHHEQWQLQSQHQTTPLISLLNRLMERASPLIRERHLWSKVHNDSNFIVGGDIVKIEFVLYELLATACRRSPHQGRIDIWCRPVDRTCLDLSITDDGDVPAELLTELRNGRPTDLLAPSLLDEPPGLHFAICQTLMQQMGGEFNLHKLEDGRMMSQVVLKIANKGTPPPQAGSPASRPFSRKHGR